MTTQTKETTAIAKPKTTTDIVEQVATKIDGFTNRGELQLPPNYSVANALKSAWLILQETVDKDRQPALEKCSRASIANALLDMVVQGLNPGKDQAYFVVYGNKLVLMRSYFGSMALAKRMANVKDIWAEVVYQGDDFEYGIHHNRKFVTKHTQKLENVKVENVLAAYCVIEFNDDRPAYTEIMTITQIHKAWAQGQVYKDGSTTGVHAKFTDEMAKKTVINRACKALINSSSDDHLFLESFNRADEEKAEDDLAEEVAAEANKELIDVTPQSEASEQKDEPVQARAPF